MSELHRRHSSRHLQDVTIQIILTPEYPNGHDHRDDTFVARMRNQSEDGLYIEMERALQPGWNISIKMTAPNEGHPGGIYQMYAGRVIWCKSVADKAACFGIGIKTLRKAVQAEVMSSRFGQPRT